MRHILPLLGAVLLAPLAALHAADGPKQKPNILLIVADDLGYGDVSANGGKDFQTPQLDALAASGMRFAAGYVTAPLCGPSRAALLTGRHQCRVLTYGGNPPGPAVGLPLDVRTLADHLKGAGYRTAALGKWHLGESAELHPMSRGFDEFFGFLSGMHDYFKTDDERWGTILRGRRREELRQYLTFALADEACAFVRREETEPFFLYLAFNAPHVPLQAPGEYLAKTAHLAEPKRRLNAAVVLALDDAVGRVVSALRESGRLENTLVFFLSDNGAALIKGSAENGGSNAPLRGSKTQLWEGGIRVPFFAAWKGRIAAGGVTDDPISALDVVPTALAAAGVSALPGWKLEGLNLLPWLTGESAAPKRGPLFWKFGVGKTAIRDGDMKLVHEGQEGGLFNVRQDIGETTDRTKARPVLARQLEAAWKTWDADNLSTTRASGAGRAKESAGDGQRERFQSLRVGEVQPRGWLLDQIRTDITDGYGPVLDKLTQRIDPTVFDSRNKAVLVKPKLGGDWWNGETTGNWLDGFIRAAYFSGEAKAKQRVDELVDRILAAQEEDGYLGIYPKARRFESPVVTQNGEFWTQACLYRGLMAYHELTGRADVLAAVTRAVKLMISKYGPDHQYWGPKIQRGGPTHNLMFVDVCEWLWRATGEKAYADFARFLYDSYNERTDVFETSVMVRNLADLNALFTGHGAHVMEHMRVPLFVAYSSGDAMYRAAVENVFPKTDRHLAAGGACISDEDILQRLGGPDIGCEYCTMLEFLHTLESGAQKMGRADLGDRIEVLAYNSAEGARLRDGKAIQYCTRDNQHAASVAAGRGSRFKLSPTHEDVAVCCPVTALKFFPYLVGGLWMKERNETGLVALAYAPNVVQTRIGGTITTVESETAYPFEDEVRMTVRVDKPVRFSLRLRAPAWAGGMSVAAAGAEVRSEDGWRIVTKEWHTGEKVTLTFAPEIVRKRAADGSGVYWQRGPLVYALPIASEMKKTKDYPVAGFADWDFTPARSAFWDYAASTNCGQFVFARDRITAGVNPWAQPPVEVTGMLVNRKSKQAETVRLVPMGGTLLRHTVFEDAARVVKAARSQSELLKSAANLARKAEVVAANTAKGYQRTALVDGVAEGFPDNQEAEWASERGGVGTIVRLVWEMPEAVESVWFFERPNPADHVLSATIKFSDGSGAQVGELPNNGATPFRLKFPSKTITWMEITIAKVGPKNRNAGFSEIAVFDHEPVP